MPKKQNTMVSLLLETLWDFAQMVPYPIETPHHWLQRVKKISYRDYYNAMYQLHKRGVVKIVKKEGKNFVVLTEQGCLETLFQKAGVKISSKWDGKWRVVIFDIPEEAHLERDRLRSLLKRNAFVLLQASVFISPWPFNREAVRYLKESGLQQYIRIMRVEEMDGDGDLRKKFNLPVR